MIAMLDSYVNQGWLVVVADPNTADRLPRKLEHCWFACYLDLKGPTLLRTKRAHAALISR